MSDPAAREALRQFQVAMRAAAKVFQSAEFIEELKQSKRRQEQALEGLAEQIRAALLAAGDELTARGLAAPKTLEDWEHLARVIEMPFETIRSDDYTLRDVYVMALAWLDRQAILRRGAIGKGAEEDSRPAQSPRKFTVAALRELTGLKNTAVNKYAKLAEVETPRQGQRNYRYSADDVRRILNFIIAHSSEKALLARCRTALRSLPEITE
jgi:hypothetical protein